MTHSTVYATASTQMLVDSPTSALANSGVDMTAYATRANVFARLMTSDEALSYIGQAAGIPGNLIDANGPVEVNGSPIASHAPVAIKDGKELPAPATYKLSFVQNPSLPTVDVYAQAPTTAQAISLANGAVTGFASFISQLDANNVPLGKRIEVRRLGAATGGIVDSGASKKIAVLVFFGVLALWCGIVLFVSRLLADLRAAKQNGADDLFPVPEQVPTRFIIPAVGSRPLEFSLDEAPAKVGPDVGVHAKADHRNQYISDPDGSDVWDREEAGVRDEVVRRP